MIVHAVAHFSDTLLDPSKSTVFGLRVPLSLYLGDRQGHFVPASWELIRLQVTRYEFLKSFHGF